MYIVLISACKLEQHCIRHDRWDFKKIDKLVLECEVQIGKLLYRFEGTHPSF